jgi:dihydropyrimidinase
VEAFDLVIRGGLLVNAGGAAVADVGIRGEKVAQVGGPMRARREIDADNRLLMPGAVDVHVHLSPPRDPSGSRHNWVDDFYTGSQAAIAGGITTIGNMTFQWAGETLEQAVARDMGKAEADAAVDYILHPVLTAPTPSSLAEIPLLAGRGFGTLKIFLVNESFDSRVDDFIEAIRLAGLHNVLVMLHCEDGSIIRSLVRQLGERGMIDTHHWAASRPSYAEELAVTRAAGICRVTGASVYAVHISSAAALRACAAAKEEGLPFFVETRPMYLHLTREKLEVSDGAKFIGAPPLRDPSDVEALWDGLSNGTIDTLATDHAPWSLDAKLEPGLDLHSARQGVADLETSLPLLYTKGVRGGLLSLTRFVELVSSTPAKLFGLWPRKGVIAPGSDADIVVWDQDRRYVVDGSAMYSRAGYSVYDGQEVVGSPSVVISRGTVVMQDGRVTVQRGRGSWLQAQARVMPVTGTYGRGEK